MQGILNKLSFSLFWSIRTNHKLTHLLEHQSTNQILRGGGCSGQLLNVRHKSNLFSFSGPPTQLTTHPLSPTPISSTNSPFLEHGLHLSLLPQHSEEKKVQIFVPNTLWAQKLNFFEKKVFWDDPGYTIQFSSQNQH